MFVKVNCRPLFYVYFKSLTIHIGCHVEFVLKHSPSVSVRLCLFPSVLRPYITFFPTILSFSVPFRPIRVRVMFPSSPSHLFQPSTLGSDPFSVSSDLALYYFRYCLAITPISPTPSYPAFLLSSVLYCFMIRSFLLFQYV